ncbi:MAG: hypothetical protein KDI36_03015, partial [Pseudomonadales bacterium]|nr:hypothetical protein [Pseudomonadales bacterium]
MSLDNPLARLPSIDQLLINPACEPLIRTYGRTPVVTRLRQQVAGFRDALRAGGVTADAAMILTATAENLARDFPDRLKPVH